LDRSQRHSSSVIDPGRSFRAQIHNNLAGELTHAIDEIAIRPSATNLVIIQRTLLPILHLSLDIIPYWLIPWAFGFIKEGV
jgi:hypothetical protein